MNSAFSRLRIYPIFDLDTAERMHIKKPDPILKLWYDAGIDAYQFRAKGIDESAFVKFSMHLKEVRPELRIIVNDHPELVEKYPELYCGFHIGQEDLVRLSQSARKLFEPASGRRSGESRIAAEIRGISTHNTEQLVSALSFHRRNHFWTYIAIGPCFATESKADTYPVIGDQIDSMLSLFPENVTPVLIGGLNEQTIPLIEAQIRQKNGSKMILPVYSMIAAAMDANSFQAVCDVLA